MPSQLRAAWSWLTDDRVLFTTSPEVGRIFMRCRDCQRVRPAYEIVMRAGTYSRLGCRCGSRYHMAFNPTWWQAAWWLLVKGALWRRLIRRLPNWDPRMPMRES